jgi:hypothetical protein
MNFLRLIFKQIIRGIIYSICFRTHSNLDISSKGYSESKLLIISNPATNKETNFDNPLVG